MSLDTDKGCSVCGLLILWGPVFRRGKQELCRACKCAGESGTQTPGGQRYCQQCGILIDPTVLNQQMPYYCSACAILQKIIFQPGDFSKASKPCRCDFCSNPYIMAPPERQSVKKIKSVQTSAGKGNGDKREPSEHHQGRDQYAGLVEEEVNQKWERQQLELKKKQVTEDNGRVRAIVEAVTRKDCQQTFYIGGVDISFIKGNNVDACAALVVLAYPSLEVVYKRLEMIQLTAPYIPGFLAFREVDSLMGLYNAMLKNAPQFKPDVMIVDGNGVLHPRRFGLACHFGVLLDIPCLGVAKTLIHVDGIELDTQHREKKGRLLKAGDTFSLTTQGGDTLGVALRSTDQAPNPIYVSQGHKVSLQSAVAVVRACCRYRVPEPTRQADQLSRQYLEQKKHEPEEWIKTLE